MITLTVSHVWSMLTGGTEDEQETAAEVLTVTNPNYYQASKRNIFGVPPRICFFAGNIFPTGLLPALCKGLEKNKIRWKITKSDINPCPIRQEPFPEMLQGIELRDTQMQSLEALLHADPPRGYLKAHPGFGKTEVIFALYACFRPCLAMLIVTRSGLRSQAFTRCVARLGEEPYILGTTKGPIPEKGLIVSTYHTLHNKLYGKRPTRKRAGLQPCKMTQKAMGSVDLLLGDEIHRSPSPQYSACLEIIQADRRYGFSATPLKKGNAVRNMRMRGWFGEKLHEVKRKEQIEQGRIARAHVFVRNVGKGSRVEFDSLLGYHAAFTQAYMCYPPFLQQVLEDVLWFYSHNLPCLVLVDWTTPGLRFFELFKKHIPGNHIEFVHGSTPTRKRNQTKTRFLSGDTKVLIATPIFSEGEDLPNVCALVMACPGRDPDALYQKIGRGLRPKDGVNILYVVVYFNRRHRFFIGHAKAQIQYFGRNQDLYTIHGTVPLEVLS